MSALRQATGFQFGSGLLLPIDKVLKTMTFCTLISLSRPPQLATPTGKTVGGIRSSYRWMDSDHGSLSQQSRTLTPRSSNSWQKRAVISSLENRGSREGQSHGHDEIVDPIPLGVEGDLRLKSVNRLRSACFEGCHS